MFNALPTAVKAEFLVLLIMLEALAMFEVQSLGVKITSLVAH